MKTNVFGGLSMKKIKCMEQIVNLFQFRTVLDEKGNEYVLLAENEIE